LSLESELSQVITYSVDPANIWNSNILCIVVGLSSFVYTPFHGRILVIGLVF